MNNIKSEILNPKEAEKFASIHPQQGIMCEWGVQTLANIIDKVVLFIPNPLDEEQGIVYEACGLCKKCIDPRNRIIYPDNQ